MAHKHMKDMPKEMKKGMEHYDSKGKMKAGMKKGKKK